MPEETLSYIDHQLRTAVEQEKRVEWTLKMMTYTPRFTEQLDAVIAHFGVATRTAARYIAKAKKRLLVAAQKPGEEMAGEVINMLREIMLDRNADMQHRLAAAKQL